MSVLRQLDAVPAYYAIDAGKRCVPFIVSILLLDREGRSRITPVVKAAIDRVVEITGRDGLVTAIISELDDRRTVERVVGRSMAIDGGILLLRCQNAETAEALMLCVVELFEVTLIQEGGGAPSRAG